ncbi:hypothetical protein SCA03_43450 [Streptomyces cacaoi]|uniref:Uncharacterized protein n=1 Tax=Streptomyces cacaoi TaxID=1898 RepID=A0A4Y3R2S1_STRCI|nr:hypothetical protein SCA03_43450 [Streptomyces cacaoi]
MPVESAVAALHRIVTAEADACERCRTRPHVTVDIAPEPPAGDGLPWLVVRGTCECPSPLRLQDLHE